MDFFPYIETIFCIYNVINLNSDKKRDGELKAFAILLYNYVMHLAKIHSVDLSQIKRPDDIQMAPLYEYVQLKNIQLYAQDVMQHGNLDFKKEEIMETYILSQIFIVFKLHV